jgi:hypothetical protein
MTLFLYTNKSRRTINVRLLLFHLFPSLLCKPEYDAMATLWIFPFNILVGASDSTAAAFMAAFITYLHPVPFPFIDFSWAEHGAEFVRALGHADVMVQNSQMRFCVTLKP